MNIEQRISILEKKLKITEKNALQNYFELHPEKIKEFGFGDSYSWQEIARQVYRDNPINDKYFSILQQLEAKYPDCFKNLYYYSSGTFQLILKSPNPFELFKQSEKYTYEKNKEDFDQYFEQFIKEPVLRKLKSLADKKNYYAENKFKLLAQAYGINVKDLAYGFGEIFRMQSSSYQKLKPSTYNLLKAITVVPTQLPKVLYRGFFMDGDKIKDKETFLKKWAVGNFPKVKLGKPTSWSTSKATAVNFMVNQDKVKNAKDGYHILLKLKNPSEEDVIADLRNFDFSRFWNQQEIIVSPDFTNYSVEELVPYQEYNAPINQYRNLISKNSKPGAGSHGISKNDILLDIFNLSKFEVSVDTKIDFKHIKDLTIGELVAQKYLSSQFFNEDYKATVYKVLLPIYQFYKKIFSWGTIIEQVTTPSKVMLLTQIKLSDISWGFSSSELKELENEGIYDTKDRKANYGVLSVRTVVELVQNSINRFVFNMYFGDFQVTTESSFDSDLIEKYANREDSIFNIKLYRNIREIEKIYSTVKINIK